MSKEEASAAASSRIGRLSRLPPPRTVTTKPPLPPPPSAAVDRSYVVSTRPPNGVLSESDGSSSSNLNASSHSEWKERIGSRVCIGGAKMGHLLFFGRTQFADGDWCGIVLDEPVGKNDGSVKGVRYFTCDRGHGIFAPPQKVFLNEQEANGSKSKEAFVRTFDSVGGSGRKTWPLHGRKKSSSADDNMSESNAMQNGSVLSTKTHAQKRMSSSSSLETARPSKIRSKSKSPAANLETTVVLSAKTNDDSNANFRASETPDFSSFTIAGSSDSTFTATKAGDATFVSADRPSLCNGGREELNSTYSMATNEVPKLDGTFTTDSKPTDTTVTIPTNRSNIKTVQRDITLPLTTIQETDDRQNGAIDGTIDDLWNFDENYDFELIGSELCAGNDGVLVRQGSLELDESLGILTPDQMRDFTLAADGTAAQTPSDEGIQEIVDDEVVETKYEGAGEAAPSLEFALLEKLNLHDQWSKEENKTSTPFRKNVEWFDSASRGICDVMTPVSSCNGTHFSFTDSPVVSSAALMSKSERHSTLLQLDVSNISNVTTVLQVSVVSVPSLADLSNLNETFKTQIHADIDFDAIETKTKAEDAPSTLPSIEDGSNETKESCRVTKDVESLRIPDSLSDLPNGTNMDGAVEFLLQHMSRNFVEHVVDGKKEQSSSEMAVSVTSIDTGYQGDAECDLQSDAGTNAANTPVEDNRKEFEMAALIEVGKHLKGGDPGSDSDFCSDMATSLTESEMEGEDRGGRGRGARVIDGRLYYSNASISKETEATTSNECVSNHMQKNSLEVESLSSVADENADKHITHEVTNEVVSTSLDVTFAAPVLESTTDCDLTIRNSTFSVEVDTEKQTTEQSVDGSCQPTEVENFVASRNCQNSPNEQLDDTNRSAGTGDGSVLGDRKSPSVPVSNTTTPKTSTSRNDANVTIVKKGKMPTVDKSKKGTKKESPSSVSKKPKSPKKNVMSKIKAMIEATSHILTNKEQSPNASGSGNATTNANANETSTKKSLMRTPKKSRWDAVMCKIAAGQAEDKVKSKKEVVSRVNTNLSSAKLNVSSKSTRSDGVTKVADGKTSTTQRQRLSSKPDASSSGIRKPTTRGSVAGASCSDAAEVSIQSNSERSSLQRTSKLPRSAKLPRPSTLNIGQPNATSMNSRSPSQASVLSGISQGSTLSQLTLASQASTHPPQDVSLASCDRSHGCGGGSHSLKPVAGPSKKVSPSPRPKLPAVAQMGTRRTTLGRASNVCDSSGQKRSQVTIGRSLDSGSATVRPKTLSKIGSEPSQHKANRKDQGGPLRSLKTSSGLVKPGAPTDNRLNTTVTRSETASAAREVSRLEALCEARTKELNLVRIQLKHCATGFDSMAVLLQYLTQELNAFTLPDVNHQLTKAKESLVTAKLDLETTRNEQKRLQDEISRIESLHSTAVEELVTRMSGETAESRRTLTEEHAKELDKMLAKHKAEIETLIEKHKTELTMTEMSYTKQLTAHDEERKGLKKRHSSEKEELRRSHKAEMKSLTSKHEQVVSSLQDKVTELSERCDGLQNQTKSLNEELMNDSDYRVQALSNRCLVLRNEVDSLKSVLEMRQTEMQDLRREKLGLKCQAEELSAARDRIKKLEAKNEDLRAMMDIRVQHERQLSSERQTLLENYEKESKVSKRLSLENEELQWRLQHNKEIQSSLCCIEGASDSSFNKSDPMPPGSTSMYFWDNEGLVNSSFNGNCFTPKTSFTSFKGPHSGTAWSATSPMGASSPRISPCKSPSAFPMNGRSVSSPVNGHDHRKQKPVALEEESVFGENEKSHTFVRLREKPKKRVSSKRGYDSRVVSSSPVTNDEMVVKNANEIETVTDSVSANGEMNGEYISEDLLVANEAFTEADVIVSDDGFCDFTVHCGITSSEIAKSEHDLCLERVEDDTIATELNLEVPRLCEESVNAALGVDLADIVQDQIIVTNAKSLENVVENDLFAFANGNCDSPDVKVMFENGDEEQQDSVSIESSGSGVPADDVSSGRDHISIESYENVRESTQLSPFSSPDHQNVTKSTTTVVISFRSNRHSIGSSRASSPLPPLLGTPTASESGESQSSESSSSSRASPLVGEQLSNKQLHLLDGSLFDGFRSPRISAGESMILDDFPASCSQPDPTHVLLKKALQDQLLNGNRGSMESYAREASLDGGSPLLGISKPDTPESTSQAVAPTDSSNMDLSWSDDELASETEV